MICWKSLYGLKDLSIHFCDTKTAKILPANQSILIKSRMRHDMAAVMTSSRWKKKWPLRLQSQKFNTLSGTPKRTRARSTIWIYNRSFICICRHIHSFYICMRWRIGILSQVEHIAAKEQKVGPRKIDCTDQFEIEVDALSFLVIINYAAVWHHQRIVELINSIVFYI